MLVYICGVYVGACTRVSSFTLGIESRYLSHGDSGHMKSQFFYVAVVSECSFGCNIKKAFLFSSSTSSSSSSSSSSASHFLLRLFILFIS